MKKHFLLLTEDAEELKQLRDAAAKAKDAAAAAKAKNTIAQEKLDRVKAETADIRRKSEKTKFDKIVPPITDGEISSSSKPTQQDQQKTEEKGTTPKIKEEIKPAPNPIDIKKIWTTVKNFNLNNQTEVGDTLKNTCDSVQSLINTNNDVFSNKPEIKQTITGLITLTKSLKNILDNKSEISKCINFDTQIVRTPIGEADNLCNQGKNLIEAIKNF